MAVLLILLGVGGLLLVVLVVVYNGIVAKKNACDAAWSQIDVQLKRRHDLIPNLVETVKGYASHEREVFTQVTEARSRAMGAGAGVGERGKAEGALSAALANVLAVAENYPQLKADQNFRELQEELTSTENRIAFARQHYNDSAEAFNNSIQQIPGNLVAGFGGFKAREFFEIESPAERQTPQVSFS